MAERDITEAEEVLLVLEALAAAGCRGWVSGGWGVDMLVGHQTRPHRDLDLLLDASGLDAALAALTDLSYAIETNWLPVRVELHRTGRGRVDLHPVTFDAHGHGVQAGLNGTSFRYPPDGFTVGRLDGTEVPCLTRDRQLALHRGYPPRDVDRHDVSRLQA